MGEYLYLQRTTISAITHVNYFARVQSVSKKTNPRYWNLIHAFDEKHGCLMFVNTSFNVRGEPKQPELADYSDWKTQYKLD